MIWDVCGLFCKDPEDLVIQENPLSSHYNTSSHWIIELATMASFVICRAKMHSICQCQELGTLKKSESWKEKQRIQCLTLTKRIIFALLRKRFCQGHTARVDVQCGTSYRCRTACKCSVPVKSRSLPWPISLLLVSYNHMHCISRKTHVWLPMNRWCRRIQIRRGKTVI